MSRQIPRVSRKPPVSPVIRRRYPSELPRPDRSYALLPLGLVGFVIVVAVTLILVVVVRGPDTHASLWNQVYKGYSRTEIEYVVSSPGPTLAPTPTPTAIPQPTPTPAPTTTSGTMPSLEPTLHPTPIPSPTASATPTLASRQVSFSRDILPVFRNSCVACHGMGVSLKEVSLTSYQALTNSQVNAPLFVPGKPEESMLINVLRGTGVPMPPSRPLPEEQIRMVEEWVRQGGQNN